MYFAKTRNSLRRLSVRLTLWHSLIFIASAIVLLALTYVLLENRAKETERYVVDSRLNQYLNVYKTNGLEGVKNLATLRRSRAHQAFFVRVGDAANQTVFLRHAEDWAEFRPEALSKLPLPNPGFRKWRTRNSDDGTELLFASERLPDGGILSVGKSNEELLDILADYRRISVVVMLIIVPLSFAAGAFVSTRAIRPVTHLTSAVEDIIQTSRFNVRVPSPKSGDELEALVHLFNDMLQRIETLILSMRESLDNVAHDLRTPLTRLRHKAQHAIQTAHDAGHTNHPPALQTATSALADCVEEAERMAEILNAIMDISEAEAGLARLHPAPISIEPLLRKTIEAFSEAAAERPLTITTDIPPALHAKADEATMFRVFANLIDNALKYTPPGGSLHIHAVATATGVTIRFADTGIGIPAEDIPRVWERLFRGDRARTERGLGLGLSFVKAIIAAHGGTSEIQSTPGKGTIVTLTLPSANEAEART